MRDVSRDHFELAVHDLLTMPDDGVMLVDVFCGDSMAELRKVTDPERLIALVPSKEFHAAEYRRRFQGQAGSKSLNVFREALAGCPDPETTFMAGWVQYHLSINQHSRDECEKHSLLLLETGGHASPEESCEVVRRHFRLPASG